MKTLLIRPPYAYPLTYKKALYKFAPSVDQPLGILYMAAILEEEGEEVEVYDSLIDPVDVMNPIVEKNELIEFGASFHRIESVLKRVKPDIIGISNSFSTQIPGAFCLMALAKKILPKTILVIGGSHVTAEPESIFEQSQHVDYVIRGEGEYAFLELLQNITRHGSYRGKNPAILTRSTPKDQFKQTFPFIQDLDKLPFPAYHKVDLERYFHFDRIGFPSRMKLDYPGSDRSISIITSRGCPYGCTFCSVRLHMGRRIRTHSVEYVINHLKYLKKEYHIKHVHFEDDVINIPQERINQIMQGMVDEKLDITWDTPNGLRAEGLDQPMLELAKQSGCIYLIMGVESGDQDVLRKVVKKGLQLNVVEQSAYNAHKYGVDLGAFFVMGFPEETKANMNTTAQFSLRLKKRYNVAVHVNLLTPIIGTDLYKKVRRDQLMPASFSHRDLLNFYFSDPAFASPNFTKQELKNKFDALEHKLMLWALWEMIRFSLKHPFMALRVCYLELQHVLKGERKFSHLPRHLYLNHFLYQHALVRKYPKYR